MSKWRLYEGGRTIGKKEGRTGQNERRRRRRKKTEVGTKEDEIKIEVKSYDLNDRFKKEETEGKRVNTERVEKGR